MPDLSACRFRLRVNCSRELDTKSVVYRQSQTLLAANIACGGLHGDVPEKKLDPLKLAPRIMVDAQDPRSCGARLSIYIASSGGRSVIRIGSFTIRR